jgi:hypothetical protein
MTPEEQQLLLEGRRNADKLRAAQAMERPEYHAKVLGNGPTRRCQWCLNLYTGFALDIHQREKLKAVTFTTGCAPLVEPDICEACYENVVASAAQLNNSSSLDAGISNHSPPNLLLRHTG